MLSGIELQTRQLCPDGEGTCTVVAPFGKVVEGCVSPALQPQSTDGLAIAMAAAITIVTGPVPTVPWSGQCLDPVVGDIP